MDKVQGGTPIGHQSLCSTCRYAQNIQGYEFQTINICNRNGMRPQVVEFSVERCSGYDDKRVPSLYDMEQIAWSVQSRNRGPAGFGQDNVEIEIEPPVKAGQKPRPQFSK